MAAVVSTERVACVLRLAVGLLLLAMTLQFDPLASWLAVAGVVTAVGWSVLMAVALRSGLDDDQVTHLATWSHWFDIVLALTVYVSFLSDPVATPVAGLPLLAYRLAIRYGTVGVVGGALAFVGLVAGRIVFTRVTVGEGLVRPPLLLAWALMATVVLMLAAESRARAASLAAPRPDPEDSSPDRGTTVSEAPIPFSEVGAEATTGTIEAAQVAPEDATVEPLPAPLMPAAALTGDERLDTLAACLSLKLETPPSVRLTEREVEVLLLLGQGHTYTKIASSLFISQSTVRNHVHNIRAKLEIDDRAELLKLAKAVAARTEAAGSSSGGAEVERLASQA
jgi:DNA-binding CsgD family transcriptional regulator